MQRAATANSGNILRRKCVSGVDERGYWDDVVGMVEGWGKWAWPTTRQKPKHTHTDLSSRPARLIEICWAFVPIFYTVLLPILFAFNWP